MKAHAKKVSDRYIVEKNGLHTHVYCYKLAKQIEILINNELRPNKAYIEYLKTKGINTTIGYIESRILRLISESRYKRWGYIKPKKQKYHNVNKGYHRRIV